MTCSAASSHAGQSAGGLWSRQIDVAAVAADIDAGGKFAGRAADARCVAEVEMEYRRCPLIPAQPRRPGEQLQLRHVGKQRFRSSPRALPAWRCARRAAASSPAAAGRLGSRGGGSRSISSLVQLLSHRSKPRNEYRDNEGTMLAYASWLLVRAIR